MARPRGSRDRHGRARRVDERQLDVAVRAFGEQIRRVREDANVSVSELASAIGVGFEIVHRWERGARVPRLHNLTAIAMALGVPFEHLVPEV